MVRLRAYKVGLIMLLPSIQPHSATAGMNPDLWTSANDADRRSLSGNQFTNLRNKWTGFNDFSQASGPLQPEFEPSGINGLGCVARVDSPSFEYLESLNIVGSTQVNFFLQFVWRYTGTLAGTDGYVLIMEFKSPATVQYLMTVAPANGKLSSRPWRQFTGTVGGILSNTVLNQNQAYIIEILYDQSANLHSVKIDGVLEGTSNTLLGDTIDRYNIYTNHTVLSGPPSEESDFFFQRSIPSELTIKTNRRYLANRNGISLP